MKLSKQDLQFIKDLQDGKIPPPPKLVCLGCGKKFKLTLDTVVCGICKKPACSKCAQDMRVLIHHDEQREAFVTMMTDPRTVEKRVGKEIALEEENRRLREELGRLRSAKRRASE